MPFNLPPLGQLFYNGVSFGAYVETLELSGKPQYDSSGRTISYIEYALRVRTRFSQAAALDNNFIDSVQTQLEQTGGPLLYTNRGFGNFSINVGGPQDVLWGPKPTLYAIKQLGGGAINVEWGCTVAIPRCAVAQY